MKIFKALIIIFLTNLFFSCGSNSAQADSEFIMKINSEDDILTNNDTLIITLENPKDRSIESVTYFINGEAITENTPLKKFKLGEHLLEATITHKSQQYVVTKDVTILNSEPPKVYTFNILNEYPHDVTSYTQGLEFYKGKLYESTGQYGESKLRQVDYKTGEVIENINLANEFFGEGLTILNNKIHQLTWRQGLGFIYDVDTFKKTGSFKYGKSKEGWGLCNDGKTIYKSDGSERIWLLNPKTLAEESFIQAYHNRGKVVEINELEYVQGKIYANRYLKNGVAIIDPATGAVEGVIDFSSLKDMVTQHDKLDVLNGIAYNPASKTIFVTGKHWDKLFEVEIVEKQ